jgi:CelD/BcsL family acetyltransferase involved in cellulose biosynthesis
MYIRYVQEIQDFDALKSDWNTVYRADPHAQIFLSWAWLRGWFAVTPYRWFVLAVQPEESAAPVAFLPLALHTVQRFGISLLQELYMGGNPLADYTGFLCLPDYETTAVAALADFLQHKFNWDIFQVKDVLDPRLEGFLKRFSSKTIKLSELKKTSCPYLALPETWDQYLREFLGPATRKDLKKIMRRIEASPEFRLELAEAQSLEAQIETFLGLYQSRWGTKSEQRLHQLRQILRHCFAHNCLWLALLWQQATPVAGMVAFLDRQQGSFSVYITGYDRSFAKFSPGKFMLGYSIRDAINQGFQVYDLLRGDEAYKFSLGTSERFTTSTVLVREGLQANSILALRRFSHAWRRRVTPVLAGGSASAS